MVIEFPAFPIEIPDPAVSVAAAAVPAVEPISNSPSLAIAVITGTPVAPVVKTESLPVAKPAIVSAATSVYKTGSQWMRRTSLALLISAA